MRRNATGDKSHWLCYQIQSWQTFWINSQKCRLKTAPLGHEKMLQPWTGHKGHHQSSSSDMTKRDSQLDPHRNSQKSPSNTRGKLLLWVENKCTTTVRILHPDGQKKAKQQRNGQSKPSMPHPYKGTTLPQLSQKPSRRSARARMVTRAREAKKGKILVEQKISLLKQKMQKTDRHIQKSKPSKKPPLEGRETMNTHAPLLNGPHRWS